MTEFVQVPDDFGVTFASDQDGNELFPMIWYRIGNVTKVCGVGEALKNGDKFEVTWDVE